MSIDEKKFLSVLKKLNCFENNPSIAVGISGGADSMLLTFLLSKWIKLINGKLYALIFDHKLRYNSMDETYLVQDMLKPHDRDRKW